MIIVSVVYFRQKFYFLEEDDVRGVVIELSVGMDNNRQASAYYFYPLPVDNYKKHPVSLTISIFRIKFLIFVYQLFIKCYSLSYVSYTVWVALFYYFIF